MARYLLAAQAPMKAFCTRSAGGWLGAGALAWGTFLSGCIETSHSHDDVALAQIDPVVMTFTALIDRVNPCFQTRSLNSFERVDARREPSRFKVVRFADRFDRRTPVYLDLSFYRDFDVKDAATVVVDKMFAAHPQALARVNELMGNTPRAATCALLRSLKEARTCVDLNTNGRGVTRTAEIVVHYRFPSVRACDLSPDLPLDVAGNELSCALNETQATIARAWYSALAASPEGADRSFAAFYQATCSASMRLRRPEGPILVPTGTGDIAVPNLSVEVIEDAITNECGTVP
jgi:hypothetical protein